MKLFWRSLIGIGQSTPLIYITVFTQLSLIMRGYISKASDLLGEIWSDKDVNIVDKSYTVDRKKFNLIDISLNSYGQEEDKKYIRSEFYRKNIRRGNTIIENPKNKYCQFARKGTPKILDIKLEYIQYFEKKVQLQKSDRNIAQIIFQGVNIAFEEGKRVELIKTQKLNGQNAQVSYNYEYDAWIICSKNVSILASNIEDLKLYKESRYKYAQIIAQQWFRQIKNLSKQQLSGLKKLLDGYTAVGQYCGNSQFQHLIKYDEVAIRWFAIVDNFSDQFCMDPLKTKKQFQKFGFKTAKVKSIILTSSSEGFYSALQKLYLKTAQAGIQDTQFGMQGSIVYFIIPQIQKKGIGRQITVGAGKIKTLQYRFLRKIRQKVSRFVSRRQAIPEILNKYRQQIKQLKACNSSNAPYPNQYYVTILTACLQLAQSTPLKDQNLRGNFITILKMIFYCIYKRISIKKHAEAMLNDETFLQRVCQIPFYKYNGLGCNTKIVYLVLGLPGMFKTYLGQKLSAQFEKINVSYSILPVEKLENLEKDISEIYKKQTSALEHFYIDGSFDAQSITNVVKFIRQNGDDTCFYKIILIKDQLQNGPTCIDENQYPFNLQTIVMCYYGKHQLKINSPRLQDKITNLKQVTQKLRKNANFEDITSKLKLQQYNYPFSKRYKLENIDQFRRLIQNVVRCFEEKNELNAYGLLIMKLQKLQGLQYLSEEAANNQIEHLIKASYPSIPIINFKK